jgi:hypothetical protein
MIRNQIRYGVRKVITGLGYKEVQGVYITFSIPCLMIHLLQCDQQIYTFHYSYDNVLIRKLLHVSGLTGPSSGTAQLYKTIVQLFSHPQYVELSHVRQCMDTEVGKCTVTGAARRSGCSR